MVDVKEVRRAREAGVRANQRADLVAVPFVLFRPDHVDRQRGPCGRRVGERERRRRGAVGEVAAAVQLHGGAAGLGRVLHRRADVIEGGDQARAVVDR